MKILRELFKSRTPGPAVRAVYEAIVAQARRSCFYRDLGVPDTVSGRFDMIVLHAFMVLERLRDEGADAAAFAQELTDELFQDMDRSLREMGVGDLSVGKKVRRMAEVFHGRLGAYAAAADGKAQLAEALRRNVYAAEDGAGNADRLAAYAQAATAVLADLPVSRLLAGEAVFGEGVLDEACR